MKHRSLCPRFTEFSASDPSLFSRAQGLVRLTVELTYNHEADLLSLAVLPSGYFHDGNCKMAMSARGWTEKIAAKKRAERRRVGRWKTRRRVLGSVCSGAFFDSSAELEVEVLQTGFSVFICAFLDQWKVRITAVVESRTIAISSEPETGSLLMRKSQKMQLAALKALLISPRRAKAAL